MDAADIAQEMGHLPLQAALAKARTVQRQLPPCGACHNCQASVPPGVLYCDADCRDDHTHRQRRLTNP